MANATTTTFMTTAITWVKSHLVIVGITVVGLVFLGLKVFGKKKKRRY